MADIQQLWFNAVDWANPNPGHSLILNCE
jgi:hypothetical protein